MSGYEELDVAHQALLRARDDLLRQLDAEPAWRALRQLDAREANREPNAAVDFKAVRANLVARLDAAIPQWRTLADVNAAIAALGTGTQRPALPRPDLPPPPVPATSASRARPDPERTRYASQSRPASVVPVSNGRGVPPLKKAPLKKSDASPPPAAPQKQTKSAGKRLAAALGLANEGPARLSAIESEVERLMRRDAEGLDKPSLAPAARPARVAPPLPDPVDVPLAYGEEAEVEIVQLGPVPHRAESRPITRLSDRLSHVDRNANVPSDEQPVVSMQAHLEEAVVEIAIDQPKALPAPPSRPERDRGRTEC